MNKRRSGAIASYLYTIGQMVVALVYVPLLLGGIGQAEYGLYQFAGSIMAYLTVMSTTLAMGVSRFYCKYYAEGDEDGMANTLAIATKAAKWASVVTAVVGALLMVVVRTVYANSFTAWELDESCLLLGVLAVNLMVMLSNTISVAALTAHEEFVFYKFSCLAALVAQPLIVVALMHFFPNALLVCCVQLAMNFALRMVQHTYAKRKLGMDTRLRYADDELQRSILRFSGAIIMGVIADEIFWRADQLILGYFYGTATIAVYAIGAQICTTYMPLGTAVSSVFLPKVSRIVSGTDGEGDDADDEYAAARASDAEAPGVQPIVSLRDDVGRAIAEEELIEEDIAKRADSGVAKSWPSYREELSELFARVGRVSLYPLLLVLTGFIVFGQDFIRLWAGEGFGEAYWVAVIIMIPFTIDIAQNTGLVILQALDKYYFRARLYLIGAVINIGITIVLAWKFGCIGAAAATGITLFATSGVVMNVYYARTIGLDIALFWRDSLKFAVPLAIMCAIGALAWSLISANLAIGWLELIVGILAYTLIYGAVTLGILANPYERSLVQSALAKLKR